MTDERRLMAAGMPLEDAISMCADMRRDGTLPAAVEKAENDRAHKCTCGGKCSCPDCPNRNI